MTERENPPAAGVEPAGSAMARLSALGQRLRVPTFARALAPTMSALAIQLVAFVVTARGLGVSAFGVYTSILAVSVIANDMVGLGSNEVLMRETARDRSVFPRYFGHLLAMTFASLVPICLTAFVVAAALMQVPMAQGWLAMALLAEILTSRSMNHLESAMVAHGDAVRAGWLRLEAAAFRLAAALLYFGLLGQSDLTGWVLVVTLLAAAVMAYAYRLCVRRYGPPVHGLLRHEVRAGILLGLPQLAFSLLSNVDRAALARFVPAAEVGAYGTATRAMQIGLFPLQVGTRVTYPHFFSPQHSGARRGLHFALKVSVAMVLLGLVSMALVVAVSHAIPLIFGRDFSAAQPLLLMLAFSLPITGLVTPPADVLTSLNRQDLRAGCYLAVALAFVGGALLGARLHGAMGVAIAYVCAIGLLAAALWACVLVLARREARS